MVDGCVADGICKSETEPYTWIMAIALCAMVFTAWGVGANDCSNSFASSVGARALKMKQAVCLAFAEQQLLVPFEKELPQWINSPIYLSCSCMK